MPVTMAHVPANNPCALPSCVFPLRLFLFPEFLHISKSYLFKALNRCDFQTDASTLTLLHRHHGKFLGAPFLKLAINQGYDPLSEVIHDAWGRSGFSLPFP